MVQKTIGGERYGKSSGIRLEQVRIKKMNVSEPLMRRRNQIDDVKSRIPPVSVKEFRGNLFTVWTASGVEVARS